MNLLHRIPIIQRMLYQEWETGYLAGFHDHALVNDITKHHPLTAAAAIKKLDRLPPRWRRA